MNEVDYVTELPRVISVENQLTQQGSPTVIGKLVKTEVLDQTMRAEHVLTGFMLTLNCKMSISFAQCCLFIYCNFILESDACNKNLPLVALIVSCANDLHANREHA